MSELVEELELEMEDVERSSSRTQRRNNLGAETNVLTTSPTDTPCRRISLFDFHDDDGRGGAGFLEEENGRRRTGRRRWR